MNTQKNTDDKSMNTQQNTDEVTGPSPSSCSPVFPLRWEEMWDEESEYDNHMWEASSPFHDDGSPFMFRIRQRLREDKHEFYEASDAEVMMDEEDPRSWETLDEAKAAMQTYADDIVNSYRANNTDGTHFILPNDQADPRRPANEH